MGQMTMPPPDDQPGGPFSPWPAAFMAVAMLASAIWQAVDGNWPATLYAGACCVAAIVIARGCSLLAMFTLNTKQLLDQNEELHRENKRLTRENLQLSVLFQHDPDGR